MARDSRFLVKVCIATAILASAGLVTYGGVANAAVLEDFEPPENPEGGYPINWDVIQDRVVLGETSLAGCTSPSSASYSNLDNLTRSGFLYGPDNAPSFFESPTFGTAGDFNNPADRHSEYGYFVKWFAPGGTEQYRVGGPSGPLVWWDTTPGRGEHGFGPDGDEYPDSFTQIRSDLQEELLILQAETLKDEKEDPSFPNYEDRYDVMVLDGTGYGIGWDSYVVQLYSWTDSYPGHVIHGPAIVSFDTLDVTGSGEVSFWFSASRDMDNYHVYGYLQDVEVCSNQIELFDATGDSRRWTRIEKTGIPEGTYRFVFVAGTFDESWGGMGGAMLWIDGIECSGVGIGDDCEVDVCDTQTEDCSDVGEEGNGLSIEQLISVPDDDGGASNIPNFAPDIFAEEVPEELPSTGSGPNLISLATVFMVLGAGLTILHRRRATTDPIR